MRDHNKYYWEGKKQRANQASNHTDSMARHYGAAINQVVSETKTYTGPLNTCVGDPTKKNVTMSVVETDSVSALFSDIDDKGRKAILNFASYKHPGGGFMVGSRAQEESLCHESFLYNVLKEFDDSYYESNRKDLNRGLYRDRALYSPDVFFIRNAQGCKCDVVTCAAPNFSAADKHVTREYNNEIMRDRVRFVLEIAKLNHVDTFIVGAWGCGVFQQDPEVVAQCFADECKNVFTDANIHLLFAVIPPLPNQTDNLTPFVKMVERWNKS